MDTALIVGGSVLAASGTVPYIIATVRHQAKPRLITWGTWTLLTSLASAAAFSDGKLGGGIFALLGALSTGAIVLVGLRYGDRSFGMVDMACLVGVVAGFVLWFALDSPAAGVWTAIAIDFVGLVPTIKHAWEEPVEETWITYALVGVGGGATVAPLIVSGATSVTSIGYPLYAALSLGLLSILIVVRRRFVKPVIVDTAEANAAE